MAEPPVRTCRSCGRREATFRGNCPHCGDRYDRRLARSARRRVAIGAGVACVIAAAILVPVFAREEDRTDTADRERIERTVEAERARLIHEQRPFHGKAPTSVERPAAGASEQERLAYRRALVRHLERAILANARARTAAGELRGEVKRVECGPLDRSPSTPRPEARLQRKRGVYDCVAEERPVIRTGKRIASIGHPFVATLDFARGRWTFCKDNKLPGEGGQALVKARIPAECVGAEGQKIVGDGYAAPEP